MPNNTMGGGMGDTTKEPADKQKCINITQMIEDSVSKIQGVITKKLASDTTAIEEATDNITGSCCSQVTDKITQLEKAVQNVQTTVFDKVAEKFIDLFTKVESKLSEVADYDPEVQQTPQEYDFELERPEEQETKKGTECIELDICKPRVAWWEWWWEKYWRQAKGGFEFYWWWFFEWWERQWKRPHGFFIWWWYFWESWYQRQWRSGYWYFWYFYAFVAVWAEDKKERLRIWIEGQIQHILDHCCPKTPKMDQEVSDSESKPLVFGISPSNNIPDADIKVEDKA